LATFPEEVCGASSGLERWSAEEIKEILDALMDLSTNENAMQSRNDGKQRYTTERDCIERMRKYVIAWTFEFDSEGRVSAASTVTKT
jgi:hypothetical protein